MFTFFENDLFRPAGTRSARKRPTSFSLRRLAIAFAAVCTTATIANAMNYFTTDTCHDIKTAEGALTNQLFTSHYGIEALRDRSASPRLHSSPFSSSVASLILFFTAPTHALLSYSSFSFSFPPCVIFAGASSSPLFCSNKADCAFGTLSSGSQSGLSPYCNCTCDAGTDYAPPNCFYPKTELQNIRIVLNATAATGFASGVDSFSSDFLITQLCDAAGLSSGGGGGGPTCESEVMIRHVETFPQDSSSAAMVTCTVGVRSPYVLALLDQAHASPIMSVPSTSPHAWVRAVGLVSINVQITLPTATDRDNGLLSALPLGTLSKQDVTLGSFVWVISSIVIVVVMCVSDGILFGVKGDFKTRKEAEAEAEAEAEERRLRRMSLGSGFVIGGGGGGAAAAAGVPTNPTAIIEVKEQPSPFLMSNGGIDIKDDAVPYYDDVHEIKEIGRSPQQAEDDNGDLVNVGGGGAEEDHEDTDHYNKLSTPAPPLPLHSPLVQPNEADTAQTALDHPNALAADGDDGEEKGPPHQTSNNEREQHPAENSGLAKIDHDAKVAHSDGGSDDEGVPAPRLISSFQKYASANKEDQERQQQDAEEGTEVRAKDERPPIINNIVASDGDGHAKVEATATPVPDHSSSSTPPPPPPPHHQEGAEAIAGADHNITEAGDQNRHYGENNGGQGNANDDDDDDAEKAVLAQQPRSSFLVHTS